MSPDRKGHVGKGSRNYSHKHKCQKSCPPGFHAEEYMGCWVCMPDESEEEEGQPDCPPGYHAEKKYGYWVCVPN